MKTAGIPTKYKGITFRSRLEARWAMFFDQLGWRWEYEPFDGHGYIPDFVLLGDRPCAIEVKPALLAEMDQYVGKVDAGLPADVWPHDALIVGIHPFDRDNFWETPAIGLLGQWMDDDRSWAEGLWNRCDKCGVTNFRHADQSWVGVPCGHYDGDRYLSEPNYLLLDQLWTGALESARWVAKRG